MYLQDITSTYLSPHPWLHWLGHTFQMLFQLYSLMTVHVCSILCILWWGACETELSVSKPEGYAEADKASTHTAAQCPDTAERSKQCREAIHCKGNYAQYIGSLSQFLHMRLTMRLTNNNREFWRSDIVDKNSFWHYLQRCTSSGGHAIIGEVQPSRPATSETSGRASMSVTQMKNSLL